MPKLKVGDSVAWRGRWGADPPKLVKVTDIERVAEGEKYGTPVEEMDWADVPGRSVVTLDTGHWAYGSQLTQV